MNFSQGHSRTKVRDVNRACFPKEKHQNSQKWAKFMNFSFWPFLWFGLPGQLLRILKKKSKSRFKISSQKFRKGVGGQSELTRGDPSHALFPMPPLGEG